MGVEFKAVDGDVAAPYLKQDLQQFVEKTTDQEALPNFEDFTIVPLVWLENALARLTSVEQDMMLRHKIIPYVWLPEFVVYGAATEDGLIWARAHGLSVIGRIQLKDYRSLVRRALGQRLAAKAVNKLGRDKPWASAQRRLTWPQIVALCGLLSVVGMALTLNGSGPVLLILNIFAVLFFCVIVGLRCLCLTSLPKGKGVIAPLLPDDELPVYTVLVPLFRETAVLPQLLHALSCLDYPKEKLDIKIILEETDKAMHVALSRFKLPDYFDVLIVPSGKPQTKPRALNYAMQFARGELLTIYDSEDIPLPSQLRLAAAQLAASHENVACLQAALEFYNPNQNWLTRQFTAEYAALFHVILPTLAAYKLPLLLGGTSNHFRVSALATVGGWDAHNVTEDADLGIRLARFGYQTGILHSSTFEEANPEIWNWINQRRRWLKGFLQSWFVHNRNPIIAWLELKPAGFCVVQCMTLGIFLSSLLHPAFLVVLLWNAWPSRLQTTLEQPFGPAIVAVSVAVLLAGYTSGLLLAARGLRCIGIYNWGHVLLGIPAYWLLMSVSAWLALWDFCVAPFHWHKTKHGLSKVTPKQPA